MALVTRLHSFLYAVESEFSDVMSAEDAITDAITLALFSA